MHIYIHEVTWPDFSTLLAWIPAKPGQHSDLSKPTCWTVEPCWSYGNLPGQLRGGVPQPVWDLKSLVHFTSICVGNSGNLTGNGFLSKAFTSNMVLYCSEALRWAWCVVFGLLFFRCWKRDSCVIWLWQSVTCSVDRYPHASFYYFDIYFELFTQIEPIVNTCLLRQIRRHRVHCAGEGRLRPAAASFNGCFRGPALSCFIWTSNFLGTVLVISYALPAHVRSCQICKRSATSPNALVWHWFIAFQCVSRDQWRPGRARPPTRGSESRNQHTSWTSSWWCRQGWQDHHDDWIAEPGAFGAR